MGLTGSLSVEATFSASVTAQPHFSYNEAMKVKLFFPFLITILLGLTPVDLNLHGALRCVQSEFACAKGQTRVEAYQEILAIEPWRVEVWEDLADELLQTGAYPAAVDAYERALASELISIQGRVNYGHALFYSGHEEAALAWWLTLAEDGLAPLELYPRLYDQLMENMRVSEAAALLELWLEDQPEDAALQWQAGLLALLRSHEQALAYFQRAAALDAALAPLARSMESVLALAHLKDDIAYQQLLIARETANQGFPLIAELLSAQAVQSNPSYAEAWALLGELQQRNGREGLPALEQAFALDPDSTMVRSLLAVYWQRRQDPARALEFFNELARAYPAEVLWQIERGKATAQAGDIPAGLQILVDLSLAAPQESAVWTALANFCAEYRLELQSYGLTAARRALQLAPADPDALLAMANVLFSLADMDSAARYYQRVLALAADDAPALYQLGLIALQQERNADARYYFTRVLANSPAYTDLHALAVRNLEALPAGD